MQGTNAGSPCARGLVGSPLAWVVVSFPVGSIYGVLLGSAFPWMGVLGGVPLPHAHGDDGGSLSHGSGGLWGPLPHMPGVVGVFHAPGWVRGALSTCWGLVGSSFPEGRQGWGSPSPHPGVHRGTLVLGCAQSFLVPIHEQPRPLQIHTCHLGGLIFIVSVDASDASITPSPSRGSRERFSFSSRHPLTAPPPPAITRKRIHPVSLQRQQLGRRLPPRSFHKPSQSQSFITSCSGVGVSAGNAV